MEPGQRPRILYVDDNQDVADSAVELLQLLGFEALACYGAAHALAVAGGFEPDVCVLDLSMPGGDGDQLAGLLRSQAAGRAILFIAVTALGDEHARSRTTTAGFRLHLLKPLDPQHLLGTIDRLWQLTRQAQQPASPPS